MATPKELAEAAERRKLKMAGLEEPAPLEEEDGLPLEEEDDLPLEEEDDLPKSDPRLAKLEQDFRAMSERVAPLQRQNEQLREVWQQERLDRADEKARMEAELNHLRKQLDNKQLDDVDVLEGLSPEELDMLDPEVVKVLTKLTKTAVGKMTRQPDVRSEVLRTLEEREYQRVGEYRRRLLVDPKRGLHKLAELSYNPAFTEWAKDTGVESFVSSLMGATSTEEVDRFTKMIAGKLNEWNALAKGSTPSPNGRSSLGQHIRRQPRNAISEKEFAEKAAEVKRLIRSRSPADRKRAQTLMKELESNQ